MKKFESILVDILLVLALVIFCVVNYDSPLAQLIASMAFSIELYIRRVEHEPSKKTHQEPR